VCVPPQIRLSRTFIRWRTAPNIPWGALRTRPLRIKRKPLVISRSTSPLTRVFRPSNSGELHYQHHTYLSEPLGTQDLNFDDIRRTMIQSSTVISTAIHSTYPLLQHRNIPRKRWTRDGQPVVERPKRTSTLGLMDAAQQDLLVWYRDGDNHSDSNPLPTYSDWNWATDSPQRETPDSLSPSLLPRNQLSLSIIYASPIHMIPSSLMCFSCAPAIDI
jgi:hypothetical protein